MCHLSVSPVPNLGKTTQSPQSDLTPWILTLASALFLRPILSWDDISKVNLLFSCRRFKLSWRAQNKWRNLLKSLYLLLLFYCSLWFYSFSIEIRGSFKDHFIEAKTHLLRNCWETAEKLLRNCWETTEKLLKKIAAVWELLRKIWQKKKLLRKNCWERSAENKLRREGW